MPTFRSLSVVCRLAAGLNVLALSALVCSARPADAQQTGSVPVLSEVPYISRLFQTAQAAPVPLLGDLPLVGTLFQFRTTQHPAPTVDAVPKSVLVSIDAKGATLGQVIEMLMDQAHFSYTLDASLEKLPLGSIKLRKVPFRTALDTVLKMTRGQATYRFDSEIYSIVTREPEAAGPQSGAPAIPATESNINVSPARENRQPGAPPRLGAEALISIEMTNAELYSTLKQLFAQAHLNYTLDPALRNYTLSAQLHNVPFRVALDMLLKASGKPLTYRVESGIYQIVPKEVPPAEDPKP